MDKKYIILILVVLVVLFLIYKSMGLKRSYESEVSKGLTESGTSKNSILTENDIKDLPEPVQKYLRYTGVIGKEKVKNFRVVMTGEFKPALDKGWSDSESEQYNFYDNLRRMYYMKLKMFGVPFVGLHVYTDTKATMNIKAVGLVTVGYAEGEIMKKSETVTVFNDMCLMAPGTLIDKRIQWETINPLQVKATLNNNGAKISADLYFNEKGELINFVSYDRYMSATGKTNENHPWSTPIKNYKDFNGIRLTSYAEAHWSLPQGDYCYGKFNIKQVEYNLKNFK